MPINTLSLLLLRLSAFMLHPLDCNFRHNSQKDCNQITIFFISKTHVFNTIYPVFSASNPDFIPKNRHPTPENTPYARKTEFCFSHPCEIVKNKTPRNYNLNTVNKTHEYSKTTLMQSQEIIFSSRTFKSLPDTNCFHRINLQHSMHLRV